MTNLTEITLDAVKDTPAKDLQEMINATEDFAATVGDAVLLTDDDVRDAARKYIRIKVDLPPETPQEKIEADPAYIPPEPGFVNINVKEASDPEAAMIKAGFKDKDEMLRLLDAIRRDTKMLDVRRGELDKREADIVSAEAVLAGRQASLEKKSEEVSAKYLQYQDLFTRVEEARKNGFKV